MASRLAEARARIRQRPGRRRWVRVLEGEREMAGAGRHRVRAKVTQKGRRLARRRQRLPVELRLTFTDLAKRSLWAASKLTLKR
jgi:DNA-binding PadR family transcriptional regulator